MSNLVRCNPVVTSRSGSLAVESASELFDVIVASLKEMGSGSVRDRKSDTASWLSGFPPRALPKVN